MIDKKLHFIWLGDNVPDYYEFATNAYSEMNPECEVSRVLYSKDQIEGISKMDIVNIENPQDKAMWYAINHYRRNIDDKIYNAYRAKPIKNIIEILERFKIYLVALTGGIYIDSDTYPIKPFSNDIFNNDMVGIIHMDNNSSDKCAIGFDTNVFKFDDIYKRKGQEAWSNIYWTAKRKFMFSIYDRHFDNDETKSQFCSLKEKFKDSTITTQDIQNTCFANMDSSMYFMHFNDFSWNYNDDTKCRAQNVCV